MPKENVSKDKEMEIFDNEKIWSSVVEVQYISPGGGTHTCVFGFDGDVPLEHRKPYPLWRVILAERDTHV